MSLQSRIPHKLNEIFWHMSQFHVLSCLAPIATYAVRLGRIGYIARRSVSAPHLS